MQKRRIGILSHVFSKPMQTSIPRMKYHRYFTINLSICTSLTFNMEYNRLFMAKINHHILIMLSSGITKLENDTQLLLRNSLKIIKRILIINRYPGHSNTVCLQWLFKDERIIILSPSRPRRRCDVLR